MDDSQTTVGTLDHVGPSSSLKLDLSQLPPVYILATHLSVHELHIAEDALTGAKAPLTYDIKEANLILGNITQGRRAKYELQWKGVRVEEDSSAEGGRRGSASSSDSAALTPVKKKAKLAKEVGSQSTLDVTAVGSSTASETEENDDDPDTKPMSQLSLSRVSIADSSESGHTEEASQPPINLKSLAGRVRVVKLDWLTESIDAGKALSLDRYTVYGAKLLIPEPIVPKPPVVNKVVGTKPSTPVICKASRAENKQLPREILERANADPKSSTKRYRRQDKINDATKEDVVGKSFSSSTQMNSQKASQSITRPSHLLHQTTSEHDEEANSSLPPMPDWVVQNKIYSCERATPLESPNAVFISQLKKIKLARVLTLDEIGVRAYSSSIASIAAYPHPIQSSREILMLPSCDQKIAHLFHEWQTTDGHIRAIADLEADPALSVLREFYEIWGVGAKTAREFYYDKGWRDLDDIVEHGWKSLSRVQQIGLKYYDEFLLKIPRSEVEAITATITHHAKLVTDANVEAIIVGGYRRGKPESGDVDVILSHRDEAMTHNLVDRIVRSLEKGGWVTHTLTLNLTNTKRNQEPLPISTSTQVGHGFDTLDKALVVWQDPNWPTKTLDQASNPKAKNPNTHRRVDIIISPWRTVGCAIAGWTSGTTFQRDLRRYAKKVKGWKFDSSGVRERGTGRWVDLERWTDPNTRCQDWKEAERRVFEGMGLIYREPWNRCTG